MLPRICPSSPCSPRSAPPPHAPQGLPLPPPASQGPCTHTEGPRDTHSGAHPAGWLRSGSGKASVLSVTCKVVHGAGPQTSPTLTLVPLPTNPAVTVATAAPHMHPGLPRCALAPARPQHPPAPAPAFRAPDTVTASSSPSRVACGARTAAAAPSPPAAPASRRPSPRGVSPRWVHSCVPCLPPGQRGPRGRGPGGRPRAAREPLRAGQASARRLDGRPRRARAAPQKLEARSRR